MSKKEALKQLKKKIITKIRGFLKSFIQYTIEDEVKCFCFRYVPITIKWHLTKAAEKKYGKYPIQQNKIVFDNYMGKGYGGNCKYVTEALLKLGGDWDIVWTVENAKGHRDEFPKGVRLVEYMSKEAMKEYYTAKVWVCNYHLVAYFEEGLQKREGQYYIQMWHGALGIKKIENDCNILTQNQKWQYLAEKNSRNTDDWISNSTFETEVYKRAFWGVENILEYGHPRNDIFFRGEKELDFFRQKVKAYLGIEKETQVLLYVPTFREKEVFPAAVINFDEVLAALEKRFGGSWQAVVRIHPRMLNWKGPVYVSSEENQVLTRSYPDIQELLAAADVVITDYSSCIFDFMLSKRPGFIYAPDLEYYNTERGFYYKLEETPFPVAENNKELAEKICRFDLKAYEEQVEIFIKGKGCLEDGRASERVCELILEKIGYKK